MTVLRKKAAKRGRRYVIVHAGNSEGWIGEPLIWEARIGDGDYHKNMDGDIFEKYMENLCKVCKDKGHQKVVFYLDNARRVHSAPSFSGSSYSGPCNSEPSYPGTNYSGPSTQDQGAQDQIAAAEESNTTRRTLSTLRKSELIDRLMSLNNDLKKEDLVLKKRKNLYSMARQSEYQVPFTVEEIAR
ncbi:hypothetical protein BGZ76_007806, partial [Entomortierella beljakovae]